MLKSYKTEINPTKEQIIKIKKTIGTCRFIYNLFLSHNKSEYEKTGKFVTANDFSKYINNDFLPNNPSYSWIKEVSTKSVKQSMVFAERAFKRFFKKQSKFPKFKKKNKSDVKMYFVKDSPTDVKIERHRIKIPTLKFIRF
jgi:putative transposase